MLQKVLGQSEHKSEQDESTTDSPSTSFNVRAFKNHTQNVSISISSDVDELSPGTPTGISTFHRPRRSIEGNLAVTGVTDVDLGGSGTMDAQTSVVAPLRDRSTMAQSVSIMSSPSQHSLSNESPSRAAVAAAAQKCARFGGHAEIQMSPYPSENSPKKVDRKDNKQLFAEKKKRSMKVGVRMHETSGEIHPRLKDAPGKYRIVAEEGVEVLKSKPGVTSSDAFSRLRRSLSITSRATVRQERLSTTSETQTLAAQGRRWCCCPCRCPCSGPRTRLFQPTFYKQGDIVDITSVDEIEIDADTNPMTVYGEVNNGVGWIPLLRLHDKKSWADKMTVKEEVRLHLEKPEYDVMNLYKTEGLWQEIARSRFFENITLIVITVNAFWMWYDADENLATTLLEADPVFQVAEQFFCVFFSFEWSVRFIAFRDKWQGFQDRWFFFDSCLVAMMVFETWVMTFVLVVSGTSLASAGGSASLLRLLRLLRLTRLARMLRSMPELMIMIKGIVAAFRTVALAMLLLVILTYIFAIMFRQLTQDTFVGNKRFRTMWQAMYTLLVNGTFLEDLLVVLNELGRAGYVCAGMFLIFILLSALTVLNMLIGILCEVVSNVAKVEKEQMLMEFVSSKLEEIMEAIDDNNDGVVSKGEFSELVKNKEAIRILQDTGVDVRTLIDYTDFIFESEDGEDRSLPLNKFMQLVLSFRSCNAATVKDAVDIRKWINNSFSRLEESVRKSVACRTGKGPLGEADHAADRQGSLVSKRGFEMPADVKACLTRCEAYFAALVGELATLSLELTASHPDIGAMMGAEGSFHPSSSIFGKTEDLKSRIARLEHYAGLLWEDLERLQVVHLSPSLPSSPGLCLWRALTEEFFLTTWTDSMASLHQTATTAAIASPPSLHALLVVARHRQHGLRAVLQAASPERSIADPTKLSRALLQAVKSGA